MQRSTDLRLHKIHMDHLLIIQTCYSPPNFYSISISDSELDIYVLQASLVTWMQLIGEKYLKYTGKVVKESGNKIPVLSFSAKLSWEKLEY